MCAQRAQTTEVSLQLFCELFHFCSLFKIPSSTFFSRQTSVVRGEKKKSFRFADRAMGKLNALASQDPFRLRFAFS